ncbi:hypothetical protein AB1L30_22385 [Bremerella sp. JC817]|uniref:hypothetical protein n=1 Tax=Bremerella sp. JC817 TaxID=3231756 RepID=UPI00345AC714
MAVILPSMNVTPSGFDILWSAFPLPMRGAGNFLEYFQAATNHFREEIVTSTSRHFPPRMFTKQFVSSRTRPLKNAPDIPSVLQWPFPLAEWFDFLTSTLTT